MWAHLLPRARTHTLDGPADARARKAQKGARAQRAIAERLPGDHARHDNWSNTPTSQTRQLVKHLNRPNTQTLEEAEETLVLTVLIKVRAAAPAVDGAFGFSLN